MCSIHFSNFWEKLTVVNEGNLALKYNLEVLFDESTATQNAKGDTLADVLQVAVLDAVPTRDTIKSAQLIPMDEFALGANGIELEANGSDDFYVAVYWKPTDNDNDWNMNNGQTTVLTIDLGVKLFATQVEEEVDSFDNTYDADATFPGGGNAGGSAGGGIPAPSVSDIRVLGTGGYKGFNWTGNGWAIEQYLAIPFEAKDQFGNPVYDEFDNPIMVQPIQGTTPIVPGGEYTDGINIGPVVQVGKVDATETVWAGVTAVTFPAGDFTVLNNTFPAGITCYVDADTRYYIGISLFI